jgi:hypothetical protein
MEALTNDPHVLDEKIWRGWVEKRKLREKAAARKMKRLGATAVGVLVLASAVYLLVRF